MEVDRAQTGECLMYIKETLKKAVEITGIGKPSAGSVRAALRACKPDKIMFEDDGMVPNNARLPFVVYRSALDLPPTGDAAAAFEQLFHSNGWGHSWRNGIYSYVHYHSSTHEVLGIARGRASVRFGGKKGATFELSAGDVAILPAGTGHQRLSASKDLLVIGAYPPDGAFDECRGSLQERERALQSIPMVPMPPTDPVYGADGPLMQAWTH
jgi:uncharacterized protein YjlB